MASCLPKIVKSHPPLIGAAVLIKIIFNRDVIKAVLLHFASL